MKKIIIIISTLFLFTCEDSVADALFDCECDIVESVRSFETNYEWKELSRIETTDDGYLILCFDKKLKIIDYSSTSIIIYEIKS